MQRDHQISLRVLRVLLLVFLSAALSACAGRPKQLDPSHPYTVSEVRVIADQIENSYFADRLQSRLEASVGRATADVGQTAVLRILVLDRREQPSPVALFGGVSQSVSLDLSLVDSETGQLLRTHVLNSNFTDFNGSNAEAVLISRLTDDIRGLLGLSGYTSYPVSGAKRDVAWPSGRPDFDVNNEALRSADPLLNGTVTPTSVVLDVETESTPAIDYSKPLLEARPAVPAATVTPKPSQAPQQTNERPVRQTVTLNPRNDADPDEPCVITLDNDCADPDSR